jgi:hypothetical protein
LFSGNIVIFSKFREIKDSKPLSQDNISAKGRQRQSRLTAQARGEVGCAAITKQRGDVPTA